MITRLISFTFELPPGLHPSAAGMVNAQGAQARIEATIQSEA
jgi:hypothetical protein